MKKLLLSVLGLVLAVALIERAYETQQLRAARSRENEYDRRRYREYAEHLREQLVMLNSHVKNALQAAEQAQPEEETDWTALCQQCMRQSSISESVPGGGSIHFWLLPKRYLVPEESQGKIRCGAEFKGDFDGVSRRLVLVDDEEVRSPTEIEWGEFLKLHPIIAP